MDKIEICFFIPQSSEDPFYFASETRLLSRSGALLHASVAETTLALLPLNVSLTVAFKSLVIKNDGLFYALGTLAFDLIDEATNHKLQLFLNQLKPPRSFYAQLKRRYSFLAF